MGHPLSLSADFHGACEPLVPVAAQPLATPALVSRVGSLGSHLPASLAPEPQSVFLWAGDLVSTSCAHQLLCQRVWQREQVNYRKLIHFTA